LSKATACPPSVVADTIMRRIELGATITDVAVDEEVTTIFCAPVARDPRCPDCGRDGRYRDTITRPLTDLPVAGYPLVLQIACPATAVSLSIVDGWCSARIWASWRRRDPRRRAGVLGMCCGG
jgi:hypothetical protein